MKISFHNIKWKILKKLSKSKGIIFHITGIACILWFLIRVAPKPDRYRYPCQQMSIGIATGYIAFWSILWGSIFLGLGYWTRKMKMKSLAYSPFILVAFILIFSISTNVYAVTYVQEEDIDPVWEPIPNQAIGIPKGANPGRVVWVWNPEATEKTLSGYWWEEQNNNVDILEEMFSQGLQNLTDKSIDKDSWEVLFKHFNKEHGFEEFGYKKGEKIAIKVNLNNCYELFGYTKKDNDRDANPYVVKTLLRQLVHIVGVVQKDITVYDASRVVPNNFYNRVIYEHFPSKFLKKEFSEVHFVDSKGLAIGREKVQTSGEIINFYHETAPERTLPKCVTEAKYLINMPLLKRHPIQYGVTFSGKNLFGTWIESVPPIHEYHTSGFISGNPAPQVDLLAHKQLGGKTLLYIGDATFATKIDHHTIDKFQMEPFNNDWTNSLFFSQDPVAIDSVMYDFLLAEGTTPCEGSQNYLHQSAEPNPNTYDPEGDGTYLNESLGVHEHWNATVNIFSPKRYSGVEENGIDYIPVVPEKITKSIKIINPQERYIHLFNRPLIRFFGTIIFGKIDIKVDLDKGYNEVESYEIYIDNKLMSGSEDYPHNWTWSEPTNDKFDLLVKVKFDDDTIISDEMNVCKFG
jgi:hypothetical protein